MGDTKPVISIAPIKVETELDEGKLLFLVLPCNS